MTTVAEVDGVGIATVLEESDPFMQAARLGRVLVAVDRQEQAEKRRAT